MEDDRDRFPWGCSCGRLCLPEDDECESCGGAFSSDKLLRSEAAKKRFLKRTEKHERRALEGVASTLGAVESSYRASERQFEEHVLSGYGDLMRWLEPSDDYGDQQTTPWIWG